MRKVKPSPSQLYRLTMVLVFIIPLVGISSYRTREAEAAFPTVAAVNGGNRTTNSTSHTVNLPAGITAGDLLLVIFASDGNPTITFPSGWNQLFQTASGTQVKFGAWYRVADGSEGGTITVNTSASEMSAHTSFRITGYSGAPEVGTPATGTSTNPNPPSLSPSWGASETLWFAVCGYDANRTVSAYPSSYSNGRNDYANNTQGCGVGSARRQLNSATEDPGTFTISASDDWVANTIAIKPQPTVTIAPAVCQPPNVTSPSPDTVMGAVSIVRNYGVGSVTQVVVKENGGTIDAQNELENVELWLSSDKNLDSGDTQLDTAKNFTGGGDGTCTFNTSVEVTTTTKYLIVRLDIKSGVSVGKTIEIQIQDITTSDQKSGLPSDLSGTTTISADWWNSSWPYRKKLTFNNLGQSQNLTDFPVLVKLSTSNFNYGNAKSDGTDLRFIDSDNTTELKYHIEKWDPSGNSFIWVRVPQIDGSSGTDHIYMYYGNSSAIDVQDESNTFSNSYGAVWHMNESSWNGSSGEVHDSTANNNDGTRVGDATTTTSGQVDGGGTFDGNGDYVEVNDSATLGMTNLTVNAWVESSDFTPPDYTRVYNRVIVSKTDGKIGYELGLTNENKPYFGFYDIAVTTQNKYNNATLANSDTTGTDGRIPMGTTGRGDAAGVYAPCVIKDGSTYKIWYMGRDASNIYRTYMATSTDGLTWLKVDNTIPSNSDTTSTNGRIPPGTSGKGDSSHTYGCSVIKDGSVYKMWYSGYDGSNWRIYYATSTDGFTWSKYDNTIPANSDSSSTNGRIPLGTSGKGDSVAVHFPTVIKDGSTYKMWYIGNDGTSSRIFYATSSDGLTWTKYDNSIASGTQDSGQTSTNGRLYLGSNGTGDDAGVFYPTVVKDGSTYIMWYSGYDGSAMRVFCAISPDGLNWTKVDNSIPSAVNSPGGSTNGRIALGQTGSGDDYTLGQAWAIKEGSKYRVWYYGDDGANGRRIYYAVLDTGLTRTSPISSGFTMITGVADTSADTLKLYTNGTLDVSGTTSVNGVDNSAKLKIGELVNGKIDEVRISTVTRSSDWIYAKYLSMTCQFTSVPTFTILGDGTDPEDATKAPGSSNNYLGQFTFVTDGGTDTVTGLTVTSANTSAIASMEIWNEAMTTKYFGTVSSPSGDNWNFSGGTPIAVSTTTASFRIIFTAKDHSSLAEGVYPVTATVTSYTCSNLKLGSDSDSATITIDNSAPDNAAWGTAVPGDSQIELNWTNPATDFYKVLILRKAGSEVTDFPSEGTEYNVDDGIGQSIVRYVNDGTSFTDTDLTNGTSYYYKIFAYDSYINYATGVSTGPCIPFDNVAPAGITDLSGFCDTDTGEVTLTWSCPGDNGWDKTLSSGSKYVIDYSSYTVDWSTTNFKIQISTSGIVPHTQVSFTVTGLTGDTTWYFQVWTADEVPNWSDLSNGATVYVCPILSVSISTETVNLGVVERGSYVLSTSSIVVTNNGNVREKFKLKIVSEPNGTWQSVTSNPPGAEQYRYSGIFRYNQPATSDFSSEDSFSVSTERVASSTELARDGDPDEEKGFAVSPNSTRNLWFKFEAPTYTDITTTQAIPIMITAEPYP